MILWQLGQDRSVRLLLVDCPISRFFKTSLAGYGCGPADRRIFPLPLRLLLSESGVHFHVRVGVEELALLEVFEHGMPRRDTTSATGGAATAVTCQIPKTLAMLLCQSMQRLRGSNVQETTRLVHDVGLLLGVKSVEYILRHSRLDTALEDAAVGHATVVRKLLLGAALRSDLASAREAILRVRSSIRLEVVSLWAGLHRVLRLPDAVVSELVAGDHWKI